MGDKARSCRRAGKEVREAIRRIGGTMPEKLPPAEDIRQVQKRLKESTPHLELDGPHAQGLTVRNREEVNLATPEPGPGLTDYRLRTTDNCFFSRR